MNIKCPYCGCCYEINNSTLKNPIGNEKLGYGWWLRCFRCQKKWWLKSSAVAIEMEQSVMANRRDKIARISKLTRKKKRKDKSFWRGKLINYSVYFVLITCGVVAFINKNVFIEYLADKAKYLSRKTRTNFTMSNVQYNVSRSDDNKDIKVFVSGVIKNEDASIAKLGGVRITIFDGKERVKSWDVSLQSDYIVPRDSLSFSTTNTIDSMPQDIKVEVSIF
jgi:hypothetical protein